LFFHEENVERYRVIAEFNTINNLSEATQVKLRGFTVGQVEEVEFRPRPEVGEAYFLVVLGIEKAYPIPTGSIAEIRSSGLVGDTFIHLDVTQAEGPPLTPGSRIVGRDALGMKELVASVTEMAHKLGGAGESLRRADLGYKLGRLGDSAHQVSRNLGQVAHSADSLLIASRILLEAMGPGFEKVLASLQVGADQLNRTLQHTDTLVAGSREDVQNSLKALRQAVERLDRVLLRVDEMVLDKEAELDSTLSNLHAASKAVKEISEHPWKLITGQGKSRHEPK
jgi:ABC-type transporter Mla subunit MlaD